MADVAGVHCCPPELSPKLARGHGRRNKGCWGVSRAGARRVGQAGAQAGPCGHEHDDEVAAGVTVHSGNGDGGCGESHRWRGSELGAH